MGVGAFPAVEIIAAQFWTHAPAWDIPPCNMVQAAPAAMPLAVVMLPRLTTDYAIAWLTRRGATPPSLPSHSALRGLLVAARGRGIVFVDPTVPEDEVRFSIAHEVAHFILHHLLPRARALRALGDAILPVLDGDRPPTTAERLTAVLRESPVGTYTHLDLRGVPEGKEARQEMEADLLAFELLAPRRRLGSLRGGDATVIVKLCERFGLPSWAATAYAEVLCAQAKPAPSVRDWFVR